MLKLEGEYLNRLQNIAKLIAVLSFAIFIVLIVFGAYKLSSINEQITDADSKLAAKNNDINEKEAKIKELDKILANKETQLNAQEDTIQETFKELPKAAQEKVLENNPTVAESLPRIYLHIGDESERKQAEKVARILKDGGYIIPKIENVGHLAARNTQLRYCQDKGQTDDLDKIRQMLAGINIKVDIRPPLTMASCSKVSWLRNYELWLESNAANQPKTDKPSIETKKPLIETKKPVTTPPTGKKQ